jgi:hypothetical protein
MSTRNASGAPSPHDAVIMRLYRSRAGQIVIPAMLMFPTLFLFVYLIYETAKLSREKIRHQFAMDAAAFVEMTNYSDFLNRTAYVNGAFPMRIFEEGYWDFKAECEGKVQNCSQKTYASILFANGAFPHVGGSYQDGHKPETTLTTGKWDIEYGGAYTKKNQNPPDLSPAPSNDGSAYYELFSLDDADHYWHPYDLATEIYKLYVQIYGLLGSVESAQFQVLKRLTKGSTPHSFMQKSYWLNTGDPIGDATALATAFDLKLGDFEHAVHANCLQKLDYWGNKHLNGGIQPYVPQKTTPDVDLTASGGAGCQSTDNGNGGLFQIESLDDSMVTTLKKGLTIEIPWSIPGKNFFNVPLDAMMTQAFPGRELHTTISVIGDPANKPSVWPDPTPKFQVRQFP